MTQFQRYLDIEQNSPRWGSVVTCLLLFHATAQENGCTAALDLAFLPAFAPWPYLLTPTFTALRQASGLGPILLLWQSRGHSVWLDLTGTAASMPFRTSEVRKCQARVSLSQIVLLGWVLTMEASFWHKLPVICSKVAFLKWMRLRSSPPKEDIENAKEWVAELGFASMQSSS